MKKGMLTPPKRGVLSAQEALADHFPKPQVIEPKIDHFEEIFANGLTV